MALTKSGGDRTEDATIPIRIDKEGKDQELQHLSRLEGLDYCKRGKVEMIWTRVEERQGVYLGE